MDSMASEFLTSDNHSLGPWPKARDTRLFSYHKRIFKVRLLLAQREDDDGDGLCSQGVECINNGVLQADIDRCVASLLKRPPTKAAPTIFKVSAATTFTVELRSWKADQKFIDKMEASDMQVYPYSFKVSGQTSHQFYVEPEPQSLNTSQSDGEKSLTGSNDHSDSDVQEEYGNNPHDLVPPSSDPARINSTKSSPSSNTVADMQRNTPDTPTALNISASTKTNQQGQAQSVDASKLLVPPSQSQNLLENPALSDDRIQRPPRIITESSVYETATERSQNNGDIIPDDIPETPQTDAPTQLPIERQDTRIDSGIPESIDEQRTPSKEDATVESKQVVTPTNSEILHNMDRVSLKAGNDFPALVESSPRKRRGSRRRKGSSESRGSLEQETVERDSSETPTKKKKKTSSRKAGKRTAMNDDDKSSKSERCTSPKRVRMDTGEIEEKSWSTSGHAVNDSITVRRQATAKRAACGDKPQDGKDGDMAKTSGQRLNMSHPEISSSVAVENNKSSSPTTTDAAAAQPQEQPKSRRSCVLM